MREIRVSIHSFVDVITNSSTEIFVQCTDSTIEMAKELVNKIISQTDLKLKADDIFEFSMVPSNYFLEEKIEDYMDENGTEDKELAKKEVLKKLESSTDKDDFKDSDGYDRRTLIIKSKSDDDFSLNLASEIHDIFDIDGCYNG